MKTIVFLVSGGGGNLRFAYHAFRRLNLPVEISGVISDRECPAVDFARVNNIRCLFLLIKVRFRLH